MEGEDVGNDRKPLREKFGKFFRRERIIAKGEKGKGGENYGEKETLEEEEGKGKGEEEGGRGGGPRRNESVCWFGVGTDQDFQG